MAKKNGLKNYDPESFEFSGTGKNGGLVFTRIYDSMMDSKAFTILSPEAKLLYFYLKKQYKGKQYNKIPLTVQLPYTEITKQTGIHKSIESKQ